MIIVVQVHVHVLYSGYMYAMTSVVQVHVHMYVVTLWFKYTVGVCMYAMTSVVQVYSGCVHVCNRNDISGSSTCI